MSKQHQFYWTYLVKGNKEGAVKSGNEIAVDILVEIYDEILNIVSTYSIAQRSP